MNPLFGINNPNLYSNGELPSIKQIRKRAKATIQAQTQVIVSKPGRYPNGKKAVMGGMQKKGIK